MITEEDTDKLISKVKIYDGRTVADVMSDIEAGLGAMISFFITQDKKRMFEIKNNVITKMSNTNSDGVQEMMMEAATTLTIIGMKIKDEVKENTG